MIKLITRALEKFLSPTIDKLRTGSMLVFIIVVSLAGGVVFGLETFGEQYIGSEWAKYALEFMAFIIASLTNPINEPIMAKHGLGRYKQRANAVTRSANSRD